MKIIRSTILLVVMFNLLAINSFAELKADDNLNIGNSTGVIVPLPTDGNDEQESTSDENNNSSGGTSHSSGGGGSYRPSTKTEVKTEEKQEAELTENNAIPFVDIKESDWFYDDVMFVFNENIMSGTGENEFSPNTILNRAMMITILHRISGDNSVYDEDIFNDVEKNSWYENAVNWGYKNKIVSGMGEKTFAPMNNLTREQLCVMLYNYTKHIGLNGELADLSSFADKDSVSDWAKEAVSWAVQEKIITGKGNNTLAPQDSATRAEAAAVIRRYMEKFTRVGEK